MGYITIDEFTKSFGGSMSVTDHPNKMILGKGFPQERTLNWCQDCRYLWPGEYKVENELWKRVVPELRCYLCATCLDKRVTNARGYALTVADFPESPVNQLFHFAYALGQQGLNDAHALARDSD